MSAWRRSVVQVRRGPYWMLGSHRIHSEGEGRRMPKWLKPYWYLSLVFFAGCATPGHDSLSFRFSEAHWQPGSTQAVQGMFAIDEFVRPGETLQNWTELLTIQRFHKRFVAQPPETLMYELKTRMEQRCPGVVWQVIRRQEKSILYEWQIATCPSHPAQHEIARLLDGEVTLWRLAYTVRGK